MKKVVPFTKTLNFKTMIREVTDIEVKHTLTLEENNEIKGDILVDGKYKMTDASIMEEEFHYKLPFVIAVDEKYDTSNLDISIGEFNFEIINEEDLKVNVDISLDGIKEKELVREEEIKIPVEFEEDVEKVEYLEEEQTEQEIKEAENVEKDKIEEKIIAKVENETSKEEKQTNIGSIFSSLASSEETFSTYYVYIVRESDTVDSILDKYKISREELGNYNDLDDIKIGSKLIIPCSNE